MIKIASNYLRRKSNKEIEAVARIADRRKQARSRNGKEQVGWRSPASICQPQQLSSL